MDEQNGKKCNTWRVLGLRLDPGCRAPHPVAHPCMPFIPMSFGGKQIGLMWGAKSTGLLSLTTATS